jgi:hypothetical protein
VKPKPLKQQIKLELRRLFHSMDFISRRYLSQGGRREKEVQTYYNIYQQLGVAWEFLALQCRHWDGYRRLRSGQQACRICGKIKETLEHWVLLPTSKPARMGAKRFPNSRRTFPTRQRAMIDSGHIRFHGATLSVHVHNAYKSHLLRGKHAINVAADRIVHLREGDVECWVDSNLVHVRWKKAFHKGKELPYGAFPSELPKRILKHFPVLLEYDKNHNLVGVNILKPAHTPKRK